MKSSRHRQRLRGGFTLVELLVVIFIMVVIGTIVGAMLLGANRSARRARVAADFQAISTALEQYHTDHGGYPRVEAANTGAHVLCQALIAPGGNEIDGATGPGFRVRRPTDPGSDGLWDTPDDPVQGRVYGAYLQADQFQLSTDNPASTAILDLFGAPILYFPAHPAKPNVAAANGYIAIEDKTAGIVPLFDANDNLEFFLQDAADTDEIALARIRAVMGDFTDGGSNPPPDGAADIITDAYTGPFLLWSAGADGRYGPESTTPTRQDAQNCDDITNFK